MAKTYFDLVRQALPYDLSPNDLLSMIDHTWWERNPRFASAYALRNHPRVDWHAYAKKNIDVAKSGIDPCLHFLQHGIFEGRKLFSRHPLYKGKGKEGNRPEVTIAITMDESLLYFKRCLTSALNQSLKKIEIVIAPWWQEKKIPELPQTDIPIKIAYPTLPGSIHLQRRACVEAACGRYILFLDSRDFLDLDACRKMCAACEGEDMVACHIGLAGFENARYEAKKINLANRVKVRDYKTHNLVKNICFDKTFDSCIYNKLYNADLLKGAFALMTDAPLHYGADIYEYIVIAFYCRSFRQTGDQLYFRNDDRLTDAPMSHSRHSPYGSAWSALKKFITEKNLGLFESELAALIFEEAIQSILSAQSDAMCTIAGHLDHLKISFGLNLMMESLIGLMWKDWKTLAVLVSSYTFQPPVAIKRVGIFYHRISYGGVEKNISILVRILNRIGYEVCVFLEEKSVNDFSLPDGTCVYYVSPTKYELKSVKDHSRSLEEAVRKSEIDVMFYMAWLSPSLLWDIALLHFSGVPVIVSARGDFTYAISARQSAFSHSDYLCAWRCAEKLHCLSRYSEIYYRSQGIKAEYIPSPSRSPLDVARSRKSRNILVIARLSDRLKRLTDSLIILREVANVFPDVKMNIAGGFCNDEEKNLFFRELDRHDVAKFVNMLGWVKDVDKIIDESMVLLSTSFTEGFPNGINEAQSRGVPCVMYDLPIMLAEDNQGIICVPQGDRKGAALEIIKIMDDPELWQHLSREALKKIRRFSEKNYTMGIAWLIENVCRPISERNYAPADYIRTIRAVVGYRDLPAPK